MKKNDKKQNKLVQLDLKLATVSVRKSIVSYIAAVKKNPRNSSREYTPIHDNSTSEQRENISIDLQSTQQSSSEIRESVVKKNRMSRLWSQKQCWK